jgi:hypothetical protein
MTKSEYSKLLKDSHIFAGLPPVIKKRVLAASGEEMDRYASIISDANQMMKSAAEDLKKRNEEVVLNCRTEVKTAEKDRMQTVEKSSRREEENRGDKILQQLNNY